MAFDHIMTFRCWKMNEFICMPHIWCFFPFDFCVSFFFLFLFSQHLVYYAVALVNLCGVLVLVFQIVRLLPRLVVHLFFHFFFLFVCLLPYGEVAVFAALFIDFMVLFMVRTAQTNHHDFRLFFFSGRLFYDSFILLLQFSGFLFKLFVCIFFDAFLGKQENKQTFNSFDKNVANWLFFFSKWNDICCAYF